MRQKNNSFARINLTSIPCRVEARDASEMSTEGLWGEWVEIMEHKGENWVKVKFIHDGYTAWCDRKQLEYYSKEDFDRIRKSNYYRTNNIISFINDKNGKQQALVKGSLVTEKEKNDFSLNCSNIEYQKGIKDIRNTALSYLNAPYYWGGRSYFGIDCSGFIQVVFLLNGYFIPRDASNQIESSLLNDMQDIDKGDLAFFIKNNKIHHVGFILEDNRIIHASGKVRIDKLDERGIFNEEKGKYTHELFGVKVLVSGRD
ncbi:MAG: NlpC/P60 family protein [Flavobacteriales bacterium]